MLLILMYHRVYANPLPMLPNALHDHLCHLTKHYPIVLPGEPLKKGRLSVCLTFDDATVDFYHLVYPLLQKLQCKAIVAVPTQYIETTTIIPMSTRLEAQQRMAMNGNYAAIDSPLCTWQELKIMQDSGLVQVASHSHSHADLADADTDLAQELVTSKNLINQQLNTSVTTFVYPYGKMTKAVHSQTRQHYRYAMRVGSALNWDWEGNNSLLYRVDAEQFWLYGQHWSSLQQSRYFIKYLANRIRGK